MYIYNCPLTNRFKKKILKINSKNCTKRRKKTGKKKKKTKNSQKLPEPNQVLGPDLLGQKKKFNKLILSV